MTNDAIEKERQLIMNKVDNYLLPPKKKLWKTQSIPNFTPTRNYEIDKESEGRRYLKKEQNGEFGG
jgi:hypothetical protein